MRVTSQHSGFLSIAQDTKDPDFESFDSINIIVGNQLQLGMEACSKVVLARGWLCIPAVSTQQGVACLSAP